MKKYFIFVIVFCIFLVSSCTSIKDLFKFNKNKQDNEISAPELSEDDNSEITEPKILDVEDISVIEENKKDTLQDLINTIPQYFEEPLVRDLELPINVQNQTVSANSENKNNATTEQKNNETKTEGTNSSQNIATINQSKAETTKPSSTSTTKTEVQKPVIETKPQTTTGNTNYSSLNRINGKTTETKTDNTSLITQKEDNKENNQKNEPINTSEINETSKTEVIENPSKSQNENIISEKINKTNDNELINEKENNVTKESVTDKVNESDDTSTISTPETTEEKVISTENTIDTVKPENTIVTKTENRQEPTREVINTTDNVTKPTATPPATSAGQKTEQPKNVIPSEPVKNSSEQNKQNNQETNKTEYVEVKDKSQKEEETNIVESPKQEIIPSRKVSLNKGETLIVEYPGSGWIYLGSTSEYNNLESKSRKSGNDKTVYTLSAKSEGTQIHHFYKTDTITGKYTDDYLEVTVTDRKGSPSTEVYAPKYEFIVPKKPNKPAISSEKIAKPTQVIPAEASKVEVPTTTKDRPSIQYTPEDPSFVEIEKFTSNDNNKSTTPSENENIGDLLKRAQAQYDAKNYEEALKLINEFLDYAVSNRDKGLYLKGQILEADSQIKNIKEAINAYNNLVKNYPYSEYWDLANKRIVYLKRFYLEAR